jgi:hypothetical protein
MESYNYFSNKCNQQRGILSRCVKDEELYSSPPKDQLKKM